jgi:hypothetical protein
MSSVECHQSALDFAQVPSANATTPRSKKIEQGLKDQKLI